MHHTNPEQAMILSGKRGASSPAEAKKKKPSTKAMFNETPDDKASPNERGPGFWEEEEPVEGIINDQGGWQQQGSPNRNRKRNGSGRSSNDTNQHDSERMERQRLVQEANHSGQAKIRKWSRFEPIFESDKNEIDKVVVCLTHFNKKDFDGYVSLDDARTIYKALGLNPDNHHESVFVRSVSGLAVTLKLKHPISIDGINKYFWYDKQSKAGNNDIISGEVIYPPINESSTINNIHDNEYSPKQAEIVKEITIDGCNYELSEERIRSWIGLYGTIVGAIEEEAYVDDDGTKIGTGAYLVSVKLARKIPNVIPMHGFKIRLTYIGVSKQCKVCYDYHKKEVQCDKIDFVDYIEKFKKDHPEIPPEMTQNDLDGKTIETGNNIDERNKTGSANGLESDLGIQSIKDGKDRLKEWFDQDLDLLLDQSVQVTDSETDSSSTEDYIESEYDIELSESDEIERKRVQTFGVLTEKEIDSMLKKRKMQTAKM